MSKELFEHRYYDTVTVGERGQVVIPARARRELKIRAGDKLFAIKGIGEGSLVLVNSKSLSSFFTKLVKHIGEIKTLITKTDVDR